MSAITSIVFLVFCMLRPISSEYWHMVKRGCLGANEVGVFLNPAHEAYVSCCHVHGKFAARNSAALGGQCSGLLNVSAAKAFCARGNMRLCKENELSLACKTGCKYDSFPVWTYHAKRMQVDATSAPAAIPFNNAVNTLHLIKKSCDKDVGFWQSAREKAYVSCCHMDGKFAARNSAALGGQCSGLLDYNAAKAFCAKGNMRFCHEDELPLTCKTGCMYDRHRVWTGHTVHNPPKEYRSSSSTHHTCNKQWEMDGLHAWCAAKSVQGQWSQVDLGALHKISGVVTQGRGGMGGSRLNQWVTSFALAVSANGKEWEPLGKMFKGNSDRDSKVVNRFDEVIQARFVRLLPRSWHQWISVRFAILDDESQMRPKYHHVNLPVDCVGYWVTNVCSVSCGRGVVRHLFKITTPASDGGTPCLHGDGATKAALCYAKDCPEYIENEPADKESVEESIEESEVMHQELLFMNEFQRDYGACDDIMCQHGGECHDGICACQDRYEGDLCEIDMLGTTLRQAFDINKAKIRAKLMAVERSRQGVDELVTDLKKARRRTQIKQEAEEIQPPLELSKPRSVIVHIPKSAGTSLCEQFKADGRQVAGSKKKNCWDTFDGPEWCCVDPKMIHFRSCDERRNGPEIAMIERYMDTDPETNNTLFCPGVEYGILLREPVSRTISHIHHFFKSRGPALKDYVAKASNEDLQEFIENMQSVEINSEVSHAIVRASMGMYTNLHFQVEHVEEDIRKLGAFTSNYLIRSLLGKQLGPIPMLTPASAVDGHAFVKAIDVMKGFEWVLRLQDAGNRLGRAIERRYFGFNKLEHSGMVGAENPLYQRLKTPQFRAWIRSRQMLDVKLYELCKPKEPTPGQQPMYNCYNKYF